MVTNASRPQCVALGCGKPRRNPTYRLLQLCLAVVLLAACATPDVEVGRTPATGPTDAPTPVPTVTPSAQPATPVVTLSATAEHTSTPTPTPTARPSPTPTEESLLPTPTPSSRPSPQTPVILSFSVEPGEASPGESVTLTWESSGGEHATIELGESLLTVPTSGSTTVVIDEDRRHDLHVAIVVSNDAGETAYQSTTIRLRCPYSYFFEPAPTGWASCPYRPAGFSWAAEQAFERGRMIWLEGIPGESTRSGVAEGPLIYVLYEDGRFPRWQRFEDTWVEGQPESNPSIVPPAGLLQPIRGFGQLWRENDEVRERLGWAVEPETGFDGAYQIDWEPDYESDGAYLRTIDGRVVALSILSLWNVLEP